MNRLVILDRDGVLNRDLPQSVLKMAHLELLPGAAQGVAALTRAGWKIAVATNQSAVGRGLLSEGLLAEIHAELARLLATEGGRIDRFYHCPALPDSNDPDRKPNPGMLRRALADFGAEAAQTPMIGDMRRDMEAAAKAGCPRILVRTGKGELTAREGLPQSVMPVRICRDLPEAAEVIVSGEGFVS